MLLFFLAAGGKKSHFIRRPADRQRRPRPCVRGGKRTFRDGAARPYQHTPGMGLDFGLPCKRFDGHRFFAYASERNGDRRPVRCDRDARNRSCRICERRRGCPWFRPLVVCRQEQGKGCSGLLFRTSYEIWDNCRAYGDGPCRDAQIYVSG